MSSGDIHSGVPMTVERFVCDATEADTPRSQSLTPPPSEDLPRLVQVVQARHRRRGHHRDLVLEHRGSGRTQDVRDRAAAAVLHADPQHAPLGEAAEVAHDPLRVALLEHLDLRLQLALERVALRRVLRGHRLHGHTPVAIHGGEDRAVRPSADLLAQLEIRRARGNHGHQLPRS
eukprot:scaffold64703_cov63-Phaeocystis_antarctica.AAC.1